MVSNQPLFSGDRDEIFLRGHSYLLRHRSTTTAYYVQVQFGDPATATRFFWRSATYGTAGASG